MHVNICAKRKRGKRHACEQCELTKGRFNTRHPRPKKLKRGAILTPRNFSDLGQLTN